MVDDAVAGSANLVAGANEVGYHYINVNYGRDYEADIVADIAAAQEGDACPNCGEPCAYPAVSKPATSSSWEHATASSRGAFTWTKTGCKSPSSWGRMVSGWAASGLHRGGA